MAAIRWRRSSPSALCRRAACCATSAACCKCRTGRWTSFVSWCRRIRRASVTLAQAIDGEPKLQAERDGDPVVKRAFDIAKKLEGLTRHASTHAAGIVIGDRALSELVPLYRDPKSDMPVTQFNMKWVEQAGLVKFDFLGLKTLTVLEKAVALVRRRGIEIDLTAIPLDDAKTYDLLARAEAVGVLQLESAGYAARCWICGPTASRTSSRWSRSIVRARWRISRLIARASTTWRSRTISIPNSSRSCARLSASSSIRNR